MNQFGAAMMKSSIDLLIRSLNRGEKQDIGLSSCFIDIIGVDTTNLDILETMKKFITIYLEFKDLCNNGSQAEVLVDEEMDSDGSKYV